MSSIVIGVLGVIVLLGLFLLRMPVGFAMAFVGLLGFSTVVSPEAGLNMIARDVFQNFSSYSLSVIPVFVLMGTLAYASGMSRRLFDAGNAISGTMRGGLAIATVIACAGFAAISGSTNATAAAMGKVCLPEMKKYQYDDALSTGCVAAAGTLGILIPPSTVLIIYGILTEQSVGKLFVAGIIPGLILAILFIGVVYIVCKVNPNLAPAGKPTTWKEKIEGLSGVIESLSLFGFVITGLFLGWFSPTQAGVVGAAGALVIGLVTRSLTWKNFLGAVKDAVRISCMVLVIVTGAVIFGHFMAVAKVPLELAGWVSSLNVPSIVVMIMIIVIYVIGGCFMDALAMVTLTIPIFYPIVISQGFDPIWFGVIIVLVTEIGVITPPVGVNVYVIKGIAENVPLETIFKGILPFLGALFVFVCLLLLFPQIATFLPSLTTY